MCGICGIINFNDAPVEESKIVRMMSKIKHRGPDDEGKFFDGNSGFGFVRLSILDLSSLGHQPMFDDTNCYMIIHNGEIYNYIEIREELKQEGYNFNSNTDTEVILKAYIHWGENCLHKFNGMWAFCIYEKETKKVFISRDRYGIKPFYYYWDDYKFIFASEIPAILSVMPNKLKENKQVIFDYLVFNRTDQTENTFFGGIKKLQHGNIMKISTGHPEPAERSKLEIKKWYNLNDKVKDSVPFASPIEYKDMFSSAVGLRLRSDLPVGVCLSGGLDSSSITSVLLKDFDKKDLKTFSAVYGEGKLGDETIFIQSYQPFIKNMFYTCPNADTLFSDMHQFVKAHGEPIPSTGPYAQYKVMELARKHVVVTLDGQGADEQLAGYHYFFGYFYKDLLKQFRLLKLLSEMLSYLKLHKSAYGLQTFIYFLLPSKFKTSSRVGEKGYLNRQFVNEYSNNNTIVSDLYDSASLNKSLLDHFEYKLEHLLKWEDRNSMFFSLESRVPFLDYRLVEKTLSVSGGQVIKDGWTKNILREAMKGVLTENIRLRIDKIGFTTPEDEWLRTEKLQNFIWNLLNSDSFRGRGFIDYRKAKKLYQKHLHKEVQVSKEIWKWINLELWFREFID